VRGDDRWLTRTERILIFDFFEGLDNDMDDGEDGFSDRATQGTEVDDEQVLLSPVLPDEDGGGGGDSGGGGGGLRAEVRRWRFGCADLVDV
jgi:hypothetical protein